MNHDNFLGRKLIDLYKALRVFEVGCYLVGVDKSYKYFDEIIGNKVIMNKNIKNISDIHSDYTCYVELEEE